jgi:GTP cyclohydrolase I
MDLNKIEMGTRLILEGIGEDINREGLKDTPKRVAKMYEEICKGLKGEDFNLTVFKNTTEKYDEMVVVKDIPFYSICEHHLVPFSGKVHIGYLPDKYYVGLSKLARIAMFFAKRPQVQERLTKQIADYLFEKLKPLGVAVIVEAEHLCMSMRGIQKPGHKTITSALKGTFLNDNGKAKDEFLKLIER